jgi:hypothetical protein
MTRILTACAILFAAACTSRHTVGSLPVPRPEAAHGLWVDLRSQMELRIENAYYKEGAVKRGILGFLGTEIARYQVRTRGLGLIAVEATLSQRPRDQPPVQKLLRTSQMRYGYYRFFYAVVFSKRRETGGAVLLGAESSDELDRLGALLLTEPDVICNGQSRHCTVFPEACKVSVEIEIVVNGEPRTVLWGSLLTSVGSGAHHFELLGRSAGGVTPVQVDLSDPNALRTPLLPGDQVKWN